MTTITTLTRDEINTLASLGYETILHSNKYYIENLHKNIMIIFNVASNTPIFDIWNIIYNDDGSVQTSSLAEVHTFEELIEIIKYQQLV